MNTRYLSGFHNVFATEALEGALPATVNPQKVPHGLYAEQLSTSAFTVSRKDNRYSWLYRLRPSVAQHVAFEPYTQTRWVSPPFAHITPPTQMRWTPLPYPDAPTDFIDGLVTYAAHGSPQSRTGAALHLYAITESMTDRFFYNSDAEMMLVPEEGSLTLRTEMGILEIAPKEIAVIPRGVKFQVVLHDKKARGYVCENFGAPFTLPEFGPIGPNSLARPHDFLAPTAAFEDKTGAFTLLTRFNGTLWQAPMDHSPLNVVAWRGNTTPYKYDLEKFSAVNSVTFDHPDPSIFTVMTSPSATPGVANLDFVIFPERWVVMENTMRLPYYHRNLMSEFMGQITGQYDAKKDFLPGGASLHNCMTAHGPDKVSYEKAIEEPLHPVRYADTLAFMFESFFQWDVSEYALQTESREQHYPQCWAGL